MSSLNSIVGYCAAALTTIAFLPQAIKTIKSKNTDSLSLPMYVMFFLGIMLWLVYGLLTNDHPIIIANVVTGILSFIILVHIIKQ